MSSKSQILLDFGGTHTKSQTWIDGVLISQEICRSPQSSRGLRGEVTIDPREFSEHAIQMFKIAKESATSNYELAVSSQMACFLLLGVDGRPASEIVSWQDERSLYRKANGATSFHDISEKYENLSLPSWDGLRPGLPLCYLYDMSERRTFAGPAYVMSLAQYALRSIFPALDPGRIKMHSSEAASTGLYDPINSCWSRLLIETFGLQHLVFPEVTNHLEPINDVMSTLVPIGDFQAAIAGTSVKNDEVFLHIATGGQVAQTCLRTDFQDESRRGDKTVQVRPSPYADTLIVAKTHLPAGRLLSSLANLVPTESDKEFWNFIDSALLLSSEISTKFFPDLGYTFELSNFNPRGVSPKDIAISVVKSLHDVYVVAAQQIGLTNVDRVVFSGGALTKLPTFMSKFETVLGMKSARKFHESDTSLLGLANLLKLSRS